MDTKVLRVISIAVILAFFNACVKTTTKNLAPIESDKILSAKEIIIVLTDYSEVKLKNISIKDRKIFGYTKESSSNKIVQKEIDFSAIRSVRTEESNNVYVVAYTGVAVVAGLLLLGAATAPSPPPSGCCPFIYSFDGDNFVFDAEPYGGSICQGLKRTEWCQLEYAKEIDNQYRIVIANELDETQYTDELKLLVVDHPQGIQVAPDAAGQIHSISNPVVPIRVVNGSGEDLSSIFAEKDGRIWQTPMPETNPDTIENLKDELIFEFPKPSNAKTAKLLVHACTSLWGATIAKNFLELHGNKLTDWYNEVNNFGPAFHRIMNWYYDEELYLLQIRIHTNQEWKSKGVIFGSGPFISEDKIYTVDISDVTGDTLKIKLTPAANFWRIDQLSVDYTEDEEIILNEIEANQGFDDKGQDVCGLLAKLDNAYFIMSEKGCRAELIYNTPPKIADMTRTIFAKTSGYYQIHLQPEGEPQYDILERINTEPGFTIRYGLKVYFDAKNKD